MMKKMLMMTAIAAMAFGAQAETYSYGLTLSQIPLSILESGKFKEVKCYLVDNSVTGGKSLSGKTGSVMAEITYSGGFESSFDHILYSVVGYNTAGTMNGDPSQKIASYVQNTTADNKYTFQPFKTSSNAITWNNLGDTPTKVNEYAKDHLTAYLFVTMADDSVMELAPVAVTVNNDIYSLGSFATYTEVVPEPTSGMLVFLGLVGMLLKRKRAA